MILEMTRHVCRQEGVQACSAGRQCRHGMHGRGGGEAAGRLQHEGSSCWGEPERRRRELQLSVRLSVIVPEILIQSPNLKIYLDLKESS